MTKTRFASGVFVIGTLCAAIRPVQAQPTSRVIQFNLSFAIIASSQNR
jgi:hypothetical protein